MFQTILGYFSSKETVQTNEMSDITSSSWFSDRLKWCPTSMTALENAEKKILSYIKKPFVLKFVEILSHDEKNVLKIRTLIMNEQIPSTQKLPLVMLHGMGAAIGLWISNLDDLSEKRPLYACDLLGFGMSSRPTFSKEPAEIKDQYITSIESWRKEIGLEKFILLGHSMGGYLATAYTMKYPQHVHHLILAEPWGFPEISQHIRKVEIPFWLKIVSSVLRHFNPLAALRMAGPWGPGMVEKFRPDILQKFSNILNDTNDIADYIYHCNAQNPSGENAFKNLSQRFGWAKEPMMPIIDTLHEDIPMTFIYGSQSWMDHNTGYRIKEIRKKSYVEVHLIHGAGHHVNSDYCDLFNSLIHEICDDVDERVNKNVENLKTKYKHKIDISNDDVIEEMADVSLNL